ncbi:seminal metalloprotease 1-like [Drosophila kikkawai]|uniref:Metalloendopeptidase n=1 Tax=Drosophila kikkawai TaxID=30033 RepID=A0A6P4JAJ2_DROKI|nr:seminal metalloprotease 1-like [Drosophila kikkawai]
MTSTWIHLLLLGSLCSGVIPAPLDTPYEEQDPELTAGYFEGDMDVVLGRNGLLPPTRRWPNAKVPYRISEEFDPLQVAHIELAMKIIERSSCIRFVRAAKDAEDYLHVITSTDGCSSQVGYEPGVRILRLIPADLDVRCFRLGTLQHELLHTLGFRHQQCSPDRDEYVRILEENIIDGKEKFFLKYDSSELENFDQPYDYASILHYGPKAFPANGKPTIEALSPEGQSQLGQRLIMTEMDINRLNIMYKCPSPL